MVLDVSVWQKIEEVVEVPNTISPDRFQLRAVKPIGDFTVGVPVPQILGEILGEVPLVRAVSFGALETCSGGIAVVFSNFRTPTVSGLSKLRPIHHHARRAFNWPTPADDPLCVLRSCVRVHLSCRIS